MLSLHFFALLARFVTVMICWIILMAVPLLIFTPPLDETNLKQYLGVHYALLLLLGTVIARSWGGGGLLLMALPFLIINTFLGVKAVIQPGQEALADQVGSLNFFVVYAVVWVAWRLGKKWHSPAKEEGRLL